MVPSNQAVDWSALHKLHFVFEEGCWQTCGGHCCKTEHQDLSFAFAGSGAGMVFFEGEFEYLRDRGLLQEGFLDKAKLWTFKFGESGEEVRFWISKCNLGGRCTLPESRPLLCKVYPFLPRTDLETSDVTGFFQAAVFDQFWDVLKRQNPCTLVRERAGATQKAALPAIKKLVESPYILFHVKAVEHFIDAVRDGMAALREKMPEATPAQLSLRWERDYLSRRAFDSARLKREMQESLKIVQARFPGFTLA